MKPKTFIRELFDERAPVYDAWVDGFWKGHQRRIEDEAVCLLREGKNVTLLDVGCGTGRRLERILARIDEESVGRLIAFDLSGKMLTQAVSLIGNRAYLLQASADRIPLRSETCDVVLMLFAVIGCLPEVLDRQRALSECARVLKPGGVLLMDALNRFHPFYREREYIFEDARRFKSHHGWTHAEGDFLVEQEAGRPSLNHAFLRGELESLVAPYFELGEWRCCDSESGADSEETQGHFLGVLRKRGT